MKEVTLYIPEKKNTVDSEEQEVSGFKKLFVK